MVSKDNDDSAAQSRESVDVAKQKTPTKAQLMQCIETVDRETRLMHRSNAQKENLRRHIEQLYQHVHEAEHSIESSAFVAEVVIQRCEVAIPIINQLDQDVNDYAALVRKNREDVSANMEEWRRRLDELEKCFEQNRKRINTSFETWCQRMNDVEKSVRSLAEVESQLECTEKERDRATAAAENATATVDEIRAQALSLANEFEIDKSQLNEEIPIIEEKLASAVSSCEQILAECYVTRAQRDEKEQEFMRKQEDIKTRLEQAETELMELRNEVLMLEEKYESVKQDEERANQSFEQEKINRENAERSAKMHREALLRQRRAVKESMKQRIEAAKEEARDLQNQYDTAQEEYTAAEVEEGRITSNIEEQRKKLAAEQEELSELKSQLDAICAKVKTKLETASKRNSSKSSDDTAPTEPPPATGKRLKSAMKQANVTTPTVVKRVGFASETTVSSRKSIKLRMLSGAKNKEREGKARATKARNKRMLLDTNADRLSGSCESD